MKKRVNLLLSIVVSLSFLAGCSNNNSSSVNIQTNIDELPKIEELTFSLDVFFTSLEEGVVPDDLLDEDVELLPHPALPKSATKDIINNDFFIFFLLFIINNIFLNYDKLKQLHQYIILLSHE